MRSSNQPSLITTVTLNAAIDKTYTVPSFDFNHAFRVNDMVATAGGKGINVARVAATLQHPVIATGFVAGSQGRFITEGLNREHIAHDFVEVDGESRLCITILDPAKPNEQTELLEPGPTIQPDAIQALSSKLERLAKESACMVFSGSLPKGCPADTYAQLIRNVRATNPDLRIILDTSGDALVAGLEARPFLIKPNEHEIEKLVGKPISSPDDLIDCIVTLMEQGITCVVVSLGEKGSIAGYQGKLYRVTFPPLKIVNPVGSGDSMVCGMAVAFERGNSIDDVLRLGSACGSANALMVGAGFVQPEDVERLYQLVHVEEILR
ncbi:1-phosphofructokinase [Paenibacillus selenitireducens]|uniref:Tagatose-6-phosphate kinase n=1 Tax=Paenibacillus selenitireducens TaxID=1324314 RepID=A0A1T2XJZ0_9BACL|nr:1-phosphofructokinase [Paenibacillus selenitireducens]OPA79993.1 1-phosphofructokinase [Paenibacillus selenitireducens]